MRDAVFFWFAPFVPSTGGGCIIYEVDTEAIVCGIGRADVVGQKVFHYELRQALTAGTQIQADCDVGGWFVSLTGYIFSV